MKYKEFEWSGHTWIARERWGNCHPIKPEWWYDPERVEIDEDGILHLKTKWNPTYINDEIGYSQIGAGLISSTEKFGYGIYEIEAKLPKGKGLWPAFWMWAWESYPPEIDVLEAYSSYGKYFFNGRIFEYFLGKFWRVETNVHLIDDTKEGNWSLGAVRKFFTYKNPSKHFIKYKLIWTKDKIEIYYNNRLNRKITDRNVLKQFDNISMNVIINNGITGDANVNDIKESDFQIKYFNYKPL